MDVEKIEDLAEYHTCNTNEEQEDEEENIYDLEVEEEEEHQDDKICEIEVDQDDLKIVAMEEECRLEIKQVKQLHALLMT